MEKSSQLAELVGIILGDGSFYISNNNHELDIAFNLSEISYLQFVRVLIIDIIREVPKIRYDKHAKCVHLRLSKKKPVQDILSNSIKKPGNKIMNRVTIPNWIKHNRRFSIACLRGLIDTDGSFYYLKPQWPNLVQLSFKNNNSTLLKDVRGLFISLGFNPSRIFGNRVVLTRQDEIRRYLKEIGTNNKKIALSSSGQENLSSND
jgi:intein/homing endonuclease